MEEPQSQQELQESQEHHHHHHGTGVVNIKSRTLLLAYLLTVIALCLAIISKLVNFVSSCQKTLRTGKEIWELKKQADALGGLENIQDIEGLKQKLKEKYSR